MSSILFVRHSLPVISADDAPGVWPLSPIGRTRAAELGSRLSTAGASEPAQVVASSETKAIETAQLLDPGTVRIDPRLSEVSKPWYQSADDHEAAAITYLAGRDLSQWERSSSALSRFDAAIADVTGDLTAIITHGTVLSLWLGRRVDDLDAIDFWSGLEMPDAWLFAPASATLARAIDGAW
jgi:broad specificity phosphatase PhoE